MNEIAIADPITAYGRPGFYIFLDSDTGASVVEVTGNENEVLWGRRLTEERYDSEAAAVLALNALFTKHAADESCLHNGLVVQRLVDAGMPLTRTQIIYGLLNKVF